MNDPHVVALEYTIESDKQFDYSKAEPLYKEESDFNLTIENEKIRFEFKKHYSSEKQAKQSLKDYIDAWEFDANLTRKHPDFFKLKFSNPEIIDRNPTPGIVECSPECFSLTDGEATVTFG